MAWCGVAVKLRVLHLAHDGLPGRDPGRRGSLRRGSAGDIQRKSAICVRDNQHRFRLQPRYDAFEVDMLAWLLGVSEPSCLS